MHRTTICADTLRHLLFFLTMATTLCFAAHDAAAALIDQGDTTLDTSSGLVWLDIDETLGLSIDDINNDVGGHLSDGWRHATGPEVCGLLSNVASPNPCPGGFTTWFDDAALGADVIAFVALLGATSIPGNEYYTAGWYEGAQDPGLASTSVLDDPGLERFEVTAWAIESVVYNPSQSLQDAGNFLVRPVPEPGTFVLLNLGLVAVASTLRRSPVRRLPRT